MIQKQQGRAPQSDDLALQVCQPEAQVSQGDGAPNGHEVPVITMVPTPLFSVILDRMSSPQHAAGVGQLGAAQVDLVVAIHAHELEDLLPTRDEAGA